MYVNGVKVADLNMGIMGRDPWCITSAIALTRGLHRIEVLYHQHSGTRFLQITYGDR